MTGERTAVVLATGPSALFQDLGRPGLAHLGVPRGGAADRGALITANQLLGNEPSAAAIECLFGGLSLRAEAKLELLLAGAPAPATVNDVPVDYLTWFELGKGETLILGLAPFGTRTYIGARGGFTPPETLGSRSTCTLSKLGPAQIREGDRVSIGAPPSTAPTWDFLALGPQPTTGPAILRGQLGRGRTASSASPARHGWGKRRATGSACGCAGPAATPSGASRRSEASP